MGRKGLSAVVVVLGLALVSLSVTADAIGIGAGDYTFGWEQKLGVAVGTTAVWFAFLDLAGWRSGARRQVRQTRQTVDAQPAQQATALSA